jgi:hypothetical protein
MLYFLHGKASDRKLHLFAIGCCFYVLEFMSDESNRVAVNVMANYLDGHAKKEDLTAAKEAISGSGSRRTASDLADACAGPFPFRGHAAEA